MLKALSLLPMAFALTLVGCGDVKQQKPPRVPDETATDDGLGDGAGNDMDAEEPDTIEVAKNDGPKETKAQKKQKCCQQCVDGLPDDKSGDPPGAIPCTKLTTKMDASCVVFFDKHPTTGKEAQECAAPPAGGEGDGGGEDAAASSAE